jgi:hypothetical protein
MPTTLLATIAWPSLQVGGSRSAARISAGLANDRIPSRHRGQPPRYVVVSRMADHLLTFTLRDVSAVEHYGRRVGELFDRRQSGETNGYDSLNRSRKTRKEGRWFGHSADALAIRFRVSSRGSITGTPTAFDHCRPPQPIGSLPPSKPIVRQTQPVSTPAQFSTGTDCARFDRHRHGV